ncbi:hypothetical protein DYB39_02795 [Providencia rettgeri]|nr:hypothetical protein DYB39_02795 [Providencia rettgeri]
MLQNIASFTSYTRHTSSCSVVDCTQLAESHTHVCSSVYLHLSPSCNSNYLEYILVLLQVAALLGALS